MCPDPDQTWIATVPRKSKPSCILLDYGLTGWFTFTSWLQQPWIFASDLLFHSLEAASAGKEDTMQTSCKWKSWGAGSIASSEQYMDEREFGEEWLTVLSLPPACAACPAAAFSFRLLIAVVRACAYNSPVIG